MALTEQLPVYRDVYRLILLVFQYTKNFPREYKYTLGQDMKHDAIVLVRSLYRANRSAEKKVWLEEFLDNYEILKLEIRLAVDLHLMTVRHLAQISELMEVIGRQITAWKNSDKRIKNG